ncbi:MAG: ABC transporter permease [Chloroflexi bacterium]|nr:ABC transporter permease [Chloroflexota bacterium]
MIHQILSITWKDLKALSRDLEGLVVLFAMPIMFIFLMSVALGGAWGSGDNRPLDLLVVDEDGGSVGAAIVDGLKASGGFNVETEWEGAALTRARAETLITGNRRNIAVVIPAGLTDAVQRDAFQAAGAQAAAAQIDLVVDPALSAQVLGPVKGALIGLSQQATLRALMPRGIDLLLGELDRRGAPIPPATREQLKQEAVQTTGGTSVSSVSVNQVQPAGMQVEKLPNVVQQNVPAWTLFAVFFIAQTMATSILEEKKLGTFRRLRAAPISRATLLLGKLLPFLTINVIQIALMFAVGTLVLPLVGTPTLDLGARPDALILISLAVSLAATGLGLLLAALAKTSEQVGGLGTLLVLTMSALGGLMVPQFVMPKFMQTLGLVTPHAWALTAYQDVLVRGYGLAQVLPEIVALLGFATVFFGIALWRFRWE